MIMGNLKYKVIKSDRKTIGITIERDNSIIIKAPNQATDDFIEEFFNTKKMWIYTKLEQKKYINQYQGNKELVNGEGFYYLGKMYKLQLNKSMSGKVNLSNGKININNEYLNEGKDILKEWYKYKFYDIVIPRIQYLSNKFGIKYNKIYIRELKYRWGSCSINNNLIFTRKIVMAPVSVIDYIICHELAHTKEKNHGKKYWNNLKSMIPDYERHINWLKKHGTELHI